MIPKTQEIESFVEGHTWPGIPAVTIRVGGNPPASPISTVVMRFEKIGSEGEEVELSSATAGQITIASAANWEFSVPKQIVPGLTAGRWRWMTTITDSEATPNKDPYLTGDFTVLAKV